MMRSGERESGRAFQVWASLAGALLMAVAIGLAGSPVALAAEGDAVPGAYERPLVAATAKTSVEPLSFTISGMKYLEGRALSAGEFSFHISAAGVARIPAGSSLPSQLRGDTLSDAEKFELVAHGGLVYYPLATQPMPAETTVANDADGAVTFAPLTFDAACLGETATGRHIGTVFCYTLAEQPPRNADGSLKDGVTRDPHGRYLYQGVAYDDSLKRIYLYVYETVNDQNQPVLAIVPLGDATFDKKPAKMASGQGWGFLNIFHGAVLDVYDGEVYLEDKPITAGEFNFDVREVSEDGTVTDQFSVPCAASADANDGASVKVIDDEVYGEPGRFFYSVRQESAGGPEADDIVLDEAVYNITVEVTKNDQGKLEAAVTHVRKKASEDARWADVDLAAQPTPVVWKNHLKATEEPGDAGGDKPGTGDAGGPKPGTGEAGDATDKPAAGEAPGAADKPATGEGSGAADQPEEGAGSVTDQPGTSGGIDDEKPDAGDVSGGDASDHDPGTGADEKGPASDSAGEHQEGAGSDEAASADDRGADDGEGGKADAAKTSVSQKNASGVFAQTGDALAGPILVVLLVLVVSGIVLVVARRRQGKCP